MPAMTDTQAQEAARLAEWLEADACDLQTPREAAALLRSQAARIAELERELARMREPLTRQQINSASRDAQISFCLKSGGTYEEELARAIEAAHGITKTGEQK